jgi:hydrogenase maturation protein HypF
LNASTVVPAKQTPTARRIVLTGRVQGLGVRPTIFRLASELRLSGTVRNTARGVEIEVEGSPEDVQEFERRLPDELPDRANLAQIRAEPGRLSGLCDFQIVKEATDGPLAARVPEDIAACDECLAEVSDALDRRRNYPLTSCTLCGPRYTVIRAMPYEREDTALADFPLCDPCHEEYTRPRDRRFHAQTTACPDCGPQAWLSNGIGGEWRGNDLLHEVLARLAAGQIVALRGLGGYQLLVDATDDRAVRRLRERKGRFGKPLAVLVTSLAAAEKLAYFDDDERAAFSDAAGPIVLVRARATNGLAPSINPGLDTVGLMRPTTPLHAMIVSAFGRPLVCTSGNRDGDALEYEIATSEQRLAGIADVWLHHDRQIMRPIDDSVVRVIAGRRVTIRLARGLAPLALPLPTMPATLAVGGHLKAALAWSNGVQCVLGPHVGDQESIAARERYLAHWQDCQSLYRATPIQCVHDAHPDYFTTHWALRQHLPRIVAQHHHAHIVAGMLEHHWLDRQVLGVAWDGTGYGTDGTIWGGEFLVSTGTSFERVARLRPFRLPGGEAAIREPWRIAMAVGAQLTEPGRLGYIARPSWPASDNAPQRIAAIQQIVNLSQLSPLTSSAGRLFDAAAAIVLGCGASEFDGQPAMLLEAAADRTDRKCYELPLIDGPLPELDWRPTFAQLIADWQAGVEPGRIAMRFHRALAAGIVAVCRGHSSLPIVLGGGVFQSRLLTELVAEQLAGTQQPLGLPGTIPPNDGGLAAGQLAIAACREGCVPCV